MTWLGATIRPLHRGVQRLAPGDERTFGVVVVDHPELGSPDALNSAVECDLLGRLNQRTALRTRRGEAGSDGLWSVRVPGSGGVSGIGVA